MVEIKHYNAMINLLYQDLPRYLKRGELARAFMQDTDCMPNINVLSKSCPLSLCFINRLVARMHSHRLGEFCGGAPPPPLQQNASDEGIKSNAFMFQIDLRPRLFDFVRNLCQQKRPDNRRHVVVFTMTDKLKHATALGLKSIMSRFASNAVFILRNESGFHVPEVVQAVLQPVHLILDARAFCVDFGSLIGNLDLNFNAQSFSDPMNICIAASAPPGVTFDGLERFVAESMRRLVELRGAGAPIDVYGRALRDFCIKIGAACIPIATVAAEILKWSDGDGGRLIHTLARMDHGAAVASKPIFVLEQAIDEVVNLI